MWPTVSSRRDDVRGRAFTTMTPAVVAALMSTLSRPTPARATTCSLGGAAAIASSSIFVAERMRTALASASAERSAGRSVPSTDRTSKSGPRASTVAGESSSAISTTGFDTDGSFDAGARECGGLRIGERHTPSGGAPRPCYLSADVHSFHVTVPPRRRADAACRAPRDGTAQPKSMPPRVKNEAMSASSTCTSA